MIRSFKDKVAEAVFDGKCPKGFPADLFKSARRKLEAVHAAMVSTTCEVRLEIGLKRCRAIGPDNTRSG